MQTPLEDMEDPTPCHICGKVCDLREMNNYLATVICDECYDNEAAELNLLMNQRNY